MKGYYIIFDARNSIGVSNKIDMQMIAFRKKFEMQELNIKACQRPLLERIIDLFPYRYIKRDYNGSLNKIKSPDFVYIRRSTADRGYYEFIREIRYRYPKCKIIVEVFTFPYDRDDFLKWRAWPFYFKDRFYRKKLGKYIDRYVTYTDDKEIFGVRTIETINGIDVDSVEIPKCDDDDDDTINIVAVALLQRHHGYERVINGLADYYAKRGSRNIQLKIVGDGPEQDYYRKLVTDNNLDNHVVFTGSKCGCELSKQYDDAEIGLASFGMYKLGIMKHLSALKTREYLAKGLPIITGCSIDVFEQSHSAFCLEFPNDSSVVDITKIIQFYDDIYRNTNHKIVQKTIRQFAKDTVDICSTMRPITDYLEQTYYNGEL